MYTLIVKVFNSSKFDNQRSAQVLSNTSEEVPDFINWHKNYAKACGLKNGRCYIITVSKEQNDAGYDNFSIKNSLELGKLSQLKKKHLNRCFSFSLSNPKLEIERASCTQSQGKVPPKKAEHIAEQQQAMCRTFFFPFLF